MMCGWFVWNGQIEKKSMKQKIENWVKKKKKSLIWVNNKFHLEKLIQNNVYSFNVPSRWKNHAIRLKTRKLALNSQLYLTLEKTSFKTHGVYICKHRVRQPRHAVYKQGHLEFGISLEYLLYNVFCFIFWFLRHSRSSQRNSFGVPTKRASTPCGSQTLTDWVLSSPSPRTPCSLLASEGATYLASLLWT